MQLCAIHYEIIPDGNPGSLIRNISCDILQEVTDTLHLSNLVTQRTAGHLVGIGRIRKRDNWNNQIEELRTRKRLCAFVMVIAIIIIATLMCRRSDALIIKHGITYRIYETYYSLSSNFRVIIEDLVQLS